jgi:hypothetical protein
VGLPTGFALAASENARHGVEVSAVAKDTTKVGGPHDNHGGAVSTVAKTKTTPAAETPTEPDTDPATAPAAHPANHGADVSAVAKDHSKTGGDHDNHGGAVAPVAHKH